ncbi:MAG: LCP family protein [Candidatus Spechtbacterales bacterium]
MDSTVSPYNYRQQQLQPRPKKWWQKRRVLALVLALPLLVGGAVFVYQSAHVLMITGADVDAGRYDDFSVEKEEDRIDVLLLGIRGSGDDNGGLLADTLVLASFNTRTKQASMVSIPRDLLVKMPDHDRPEKINFAYALGEQRKPGGGGLSLSKEVVKYVTGVYVDHAIVVNFAGFERLVDTLGGVAITRDSAFTESQQWRGETTGSRYWVKKTVPATTEPAPAEGVDSEDEPDQPTAESEPKTITNPPQEYWVFHIPAGTHTLGGEDALYYIRSRYTTSDFDRMYRQQQVLDGVKRKALSLGILANPVKAFEVMDILGRNVRTDAGLNDIRSLISMAQDYQSTPVETLVLDDSEGGLLRAAQDDGRYVLLPRAGDFSQIRAIMASMLRD